MVGEEQVKTDKNERMFKESEKKTKNITRKKEHQMTNDGKYRDLDDERIKTDDVHGGGQSEQQEYPMTN